MTSTALFMLALSVGVARAGQPLVTDDASVVAPGTCQLEAWFSPSRDTRDFGAQPACNVTGNLELAVGGARSRPQEGASSSALALQAKSILRQRGDTAWALAGAAGALRETGSSHGDSPFQTGYARLIASWYPRDGVQVDLNAGVAHRHETGTYAIAGAAIQYAMAARAQCLAEVYRDAPGATRFQVGGRWIAIPDRLEAFAAYGNRFSPAQASWSAVVGVRFQTAAFLP